jgi:hypothetical protein
VERFDRPGGVFAVGLFGVLIGRTVDAGGFFLGDRANLAALRGPSAQQRDGATRRIDAGLLDRLRSLLVDHSCSGVGIPPLLTASSPVNLGGRPPSPTGPFLAR